MKYLFFTLLTLSSLCSSAQSTLLHYHSDADTFKEIPAYDCYFIHGLSITIDEKSFVQIKINTHNNTLFLHEHPKVKVGVFSPCDSLILKTDWETIRSTDMQSISLYQQNQLLTHLRLHIYPVNLPCDCPDKSITISQLYQYLLIEDCYLRFYINPEYGTEQDLKIWSIKHAKPIQTTKP